MTDTDTDTDFAYLADITPSTHPSRDAQHFRRIIAARKMMEAAEEELADAVGAARAAGDSWAVIGMALDTTRQAAQQRFGTVAESWHAHGPSFPLLVLSAAMEHGWKGWLKMDDDGHVRKVDHFRYTDVEIVRFKG